MNIYEMFEDLEGLDRPKKTPKGVRQIRGRLLGMTIYDDAECDEKYFGENTLAYFKRRWSSYGTPKKIEYGTLILCGLLCALFVLLPVIVWTIGALFSLIGNILYYGSMVVVGFIMIAHWLIFGR